MSILLDGPVAWIGPIVVLAGSWVAFSFRKITLGSILLGCGAAWTLAMMIP